MKAWCTGVPALAVTLLLLSAGTAHVPPHPADDELAELYARQVRIATAGLAAMEAAPERHTARELVELITRVRDCRLRVAATRDDRVEACNWSIRKLGELHERTRLLAESGRAAPYAVLAVELEVNEARIRLLEIEREH
ncbi:MAG: hypothetical protein ACYTJ0_14980 [Planctomycetota bacterium]|jgi:hypothetical protein